MVWILPEDAAMTLREYFAWAFLGVLLLPIALLAITKDQEISLNLLFVGYNGSVLGFCFLLVAGILVGCIRTRSK